MIQRDATSNVQRTIFALVSLALIPAAGAQAQQVVRDEPGAAATPVVPTTAVVAAPASIPAAPAVSTPASAAAAAPTDAAVQPAAATVATAPAYYGDPYGFVNWLNSTRAQYGLPAVGYDPNLAGWAAVNNNHQTSRGMGHFVMGPARRQNCAMGNYASIGAMWMASSAHRSALLDPTIRYIGIAGAGAYWTFNAY